MVIAIMIGCAYVFKSDFEMKWVTKVLTIALTV